MPTDRVPEEVLNELELLWAEKVNHQFSSENPHDVLEEEYERVGDVCIRLEEMIDEHLIDLLTEIRELRANEQQRSRQQTAVSTAVYCDRCDGCGWYEGGKTLQTDCEKCKGTGVLDSATEVEHGT